MEEMESLVERLVALTEQDLRSLRSDAQLMSYVQKVNHLIDSNLSQQQQQQQNINDNYTTNASSSSQNDNDNINNINNNNNNNNSWRDNNNDSGQRFVDENALDLRVSANICSGDNANFTTNTNIKKPKGEFDEPNLEEVDRRMRSLVIQDNYHRFNQAAAAGKCACTLGSEFRNNNTAQSILSRIDQWRQMPSQQRISYKWDVSFLPRDIPLNDINRFESLRRQASGGRANFGGIAKRKPHNIGGTRQFLLILYCLWGHPGRDDPMQREGYCPQCFARIMKLNDQSILVRVVNHFNMKHKRGANPNINVRPHD